MKKLLFALLVVTGFVAFAPKAEAGHYKRVWDGCGYVYYHQPHLGGGGCAPIYRGGYHQPVRKYYSQPVRRHYSAPVRYRNYDDCDRPVRSNRSRFAVSFGF